MNSAARRKRRGTRNLEGDGGCVASALSACSPGGAGGGGEGGFTMVEIAMAIGVIGFALVAIIGILPAGMNVQKDTGEDTVVSQDAQFFLEALRNGGTNITSTPGQPYLQGLDFLTNHVESITIVNNNGETPGTTVYTNNPSAGVNYLENGQMILGLLSTPEFTGSVYPYYTNTVIARVRALNGPASDEAGADPVMLFRYLMTVNIAPFESFALQSTNFNNYVASITNPAYLAAYDRWLEVPFLHSQLFDVRLTFRWPILPNGNPGPRHLTFRTMMAGHYSQDPARQTQWLIHPQWYSTNANTLIQ